MKLQNSTITRGGGSAKLGGPDQPPPPLQYFEDVEKRTEAEIQNRKSASSAYRKTC